MVYLTHKMKKGRKYLYLEKKARIDGKVKRVFQIYLGPEDKIEERGTLLNSDKLKIKTYSLGSAILWNVAEEIGLRQVINEHTLKKRHQGLTVGDYITVAIINRVIEPCSKNSLSEWLENDYLSILYQDAIDQFNSQSYWNHFQYFDPELLQTIQRDLTRSVLDQFDIELDCVLYDPTNFYTHQTFHDDDQLAQFGNSKEKRYDKRVVNLSLLSSKSTGIPLWHQTYAGNIHDANHFKSAISKITEFMQFMEYELTELTLVFDKGNHSKEVMTYIHDSSLGIITSVRKSSHKSKMQEPTHKFKFIELSNGKNVAYLRYDHKFHGIDGVLYVLYDRQVKKRSLAIFARDLKQKREILNEFVTSRLNQHKWRDKSNVEEKLVNLCGNKLFKNIFQFEVTGDYAELKVNIAEDVDAKARHCRQLGRSAVFTTRRTWKPKTTIQVYRDKYRIEDSFRHIKDPTSISIRPMYHHSILSTHVHVFTCVIAHLLDSLVRHILRLEDVIVSSKKLKNQLNKLQLTEVGAGQLKQPLMQLNTISGDTRKITKIFDLDNIIEAIKE